MDYARIYKAFIADRRCREPTLEGYTERHHIVPRVLGGDDAPNNLIRLTAEDHFFAHLLLAKIHGGVLWAPIAFMVSGQRKDYRPIQSRRSYGWAARAMAKARSGSNAVQFDWTQYELEHQDGRRWSGTQSAMHDDLGISRPMANLLVKRKVRSALGWFHRGERPVAFNRGSPGEGHPMYRPEVIHFRHVDGREFRGTQSELCRVHGMSKSAACTLARGKVRVANGWYVDGRPPVRKGRGARWFKDEKKAVPLAT